MFDNRNGEAICRKGHNTQPLRAMDLRSRNSVETGHFGVQCLLLTNVDAKSNSICFENNHLFNQAAKLTQSCGLGVGF